MVQYAHRTEPCGTNCTLRVRFTDDSILLRELRRRGRISVTRSKSGQGQTLARKRNKTHGYGEGHGGRNLHGCNRHFPLQDMRVPVSEDKFRKTMDVSLYRGLEHPNNLQPVEKLPAQRIWLLEAPRSRLARQTPWDGWIFLGQHSLLLVDT